MRHRFLLWALLYGPTTTFAGLACAACSAGVPGLAVIFGVAGFSISLAVTAHILEQGAQ